MKIRTSFGIVVSTYMNLSCITSVCTKLLSFFVVLILLSSFGLHSIQIPHSHPGHQKFTQDTHHDEKSAQTGDFSELTVYMHAAEKKLFLMIVSVGSLVVVAATTVSSNWVTFLQLVSLTFALLLSRNKKRSKLIPNYLRMYFARGILNPKLY